jgi:hypothetical protein
MILLIIGLFCLVGGLSVRVTTRRLWRDVEHLDPSTTESIDSIVMLPATSYREAPRVAPPFEGRPVRLRGRVVGGSYATLQTFDGRPAVFTLRGFQAGARGRGGFEVEREDFWLEDGGDHRACVRLSRTAGIPAMSGVPRVTGARRPEPIFYGQSSMFLHASDESYDKWAGAETHRMTETQRAWVLERLKWMSDAAFMRVTEQAIAPGDEVTVAGVATWDGRQLVVDGDAGNGHPLRIANTPFEEVSRFAKSYRRQSDLFVIAGATLTVIWLGAQALGLSLF